MLGPWSPIASYMRKLWNDEGYDIYCHKVQRKFYSTHTQKLILFFILKQFHSEAELGWQTKALVVLLWSGEPAHSPPQQSSQETPQTLGRAVFAKSHCRECWGTGGFCWCLSAASTQKNFADLRTSTFAFHKDEGSQATIHCGMDMLGQQASWLSRFTC